MANNTYFFAPDRSRARANMITTWQGGLLVPVWSSLTAWQFAGSGLSATIVSGAGTIGSEGLWSAAGDAVSGAWLVEYVGNLLDVTASGTINAYSLPANHIFVGAAYNANFKQTYTVDANGGVWYPNNKTVSRVGGAGGFGANAWGLDASGSTLFSIVGSNQVGVFTLSNATNGTSGMIATPLAGLQRLTVASGKLAVAGYDYETLALALDEIAFDLIAPFALATSSVSGAILLVTNASETWTVTQTLTGQGSPSHIAWRNDGLGGLATDSAAGKIIPVSYGGGSISVGTAITLAGAAQVAIESQSKDALVVQQGQNAFMPLTLSGSTWSTGTAILLNGVASVSMYGANFAAVGFASGCAFYSLNAHVWTEQEVVTLPYTPTHMYADPYGYLYVVGSQGTQGYLSIFNGSTLMQTLNWNGTADAVTAQQMQVAVADNGNGMLRIFGFSGLNWAQQATAASPGSVKHMNQAGITLFALGPTAFMYQWVGPYQLQQSRIGAIGQYIGGNWVTTTLGISEFPEALTYDASGVLWAATLQNALYSINSSGTVLTSGTIPVYNGQQQTAQMGVSWLKWWNGQLYAATSMSGAFIQGASGTAAPPPAPIPPPPPGPPATPAPAPTPTPPPPPPPPPPSLAPTQAQAAGYTALAFSDDFAYGDLTFIDFTHAGNDLKKTWHSGDPWNTPYPQTSFAVGNSIVTITGPAGLSTGTYDSTEQTGKFWQGGYFEIYANGNNWIGLSLYSEAWGAIRTCQSIASYGGASEIDIIETDTSAAGDAITTVHTNAPAAAYCPPADQQNSNNVNPMPAGGLTQNQWHIYGCLWTQKTISWYVDNVQVCQTSSFGADWQPMFLSMSVGAGGVLGGAAVGTPQLQVDWVRVWGPGGPPTPPPAPPPPPPPPAVGPDNPMLCPTSFISVPAGADIQSAITSAVSGQCLSLAAATFNLPATVNLKSGVSLMGVSGTVVTAPAGAGIAFHGVGVQGIWVSGITFDGNNGGASGASGYFHLEQNCNTVVIRDNTFRNNTGRSDLYVANSSQIFFQRNYSSPGEWFPVQAVYNDGAAHDRLEITDNTLNGFTTTGVSIGCFASGASGSTIADLHIDRNLIENWTANANNIGVNLGGSGGSILNGTVWGNTFTGTPGDNQWGINLAQSNVTCDGNIFTNVAYPFMIVAAPGAAILLNNMSGFSGTYPYNEGTGYVQDEWIGANTINSSTVTGWPGHTYGAQPTLYLESGLPFAACVAGSGSPVNSGPVMPAPALGGWLPNSASVTSIAQMLTVAPQYNHITFAMAYGADNSGTLTLDLTSYGGNGTQLKADIQTWHNSFDQHGHRRTITVLVTDAFPGAGNAVFLTPTNATNAYNSLVSIINQYGFDGIEFDLEGGEGTTWNATTINSIVSQLQAHFGAKNLIIGQSPRPYELHAGATKRGWMASWNYSAIQYYFGANAYGPDFVAANVTCLEGGTTCFANGTVNYDEGLSQFVNGSDGGVIVPASKIIFGQTPLDSTGAQDGLPPSDYASSYQSLLQTYPTLGGAECWQLLVDKDNNWSFASAFSFINGGSSSGPAPAPGPSPSPPPPSSGTVKIDSVEAGGVGHNVGNNGASPLTWSFVNTAGNFLVVGVVVDAPSGTSAIGAVTYNGVAMTPGPTISWGSGANNAQLFTLLNPATGSHTVSVSFSSAFNCLAGAISFSGVNTTTPTGVSASAKQDSGGVGTASVALTGSSAGSIIASILGTGTSVQGANSPTALAWLMNVDGFDGGNNAAGGTQAATGSDTISYAIASDWFGLAALEVKAQPSSSPPPPPPPPPPSSGLPAKLVGTWHWAYSGGVSLATVQADAPQYNYAGYVVAVGNGAGNDGTVHLDTAVVQADVNAWKAAGKWITLVVGGSSADSGQPGQINLLNSTQVTNFVNSVASICSTYGFQGVDLDLEDSTLWTTATLGSAIQQLKSKMGSTFSVSVVPAPYQMRSGGAYLALYQSVGSLIDLVSVQWYSQSGQTDSWFINTYILPDVNTFVKTEGIPASKLVMGCANITTGEGAPGWPITYCTAYSDAVASGITLRGMINWHDGSGGDSSNNWTFAVNAGSTVG